MSLARERVLLVTVTVVPLVMPLVTVMARWQVSTGCRCGGGLLLWPRCPAPRNSCLTSPLPPEQLPLEEDARAYPRRSPAVKISGRAGKPRAVIVLKGCRAQIHSLPIILSAGAAGQARTESAHGRRQLACALNLCPQVCLSHDLALTPQAPPRTVWVPHQRGLCASVGRTQRGEARVER